MNELDAFDYVLPDAAIAQRPLEERSSSRLLVDGDAVEHRHTADLLELVRPGDVVVVNRSKVLPARLAARRHTGGACEVLLLEEVDPGAGECWRWSGRAARSTRAQPSR
ncbi:MAG: S-adenosylmethionine:tRNA ribosyltransferase-isomerase [Acidobacteria bacterium]|nr:S-adenosylmethionine:tRNA ribosyltransferase-isomerase [Acidobacteriota bacterium]